MKQTAQKHCFLSAQLFLFAALVCNGHHSAAAQSVPPQNAMPTATGASMNTLMPEPRSAQWNAGELPITSSFSASFSSFRDARLDAATSRMLDRLEYLSGSELSKQPATGNSGAVLTIDVAGPGEAVQSLDEDESYTLTVDNQHIRLQAATDVGAMRGMETLLQLVHLSQGRYVLPAVSIQDSPRFRWRGLMIDCGRHFYPVDVILRTLDGMAAVKLNVFHWHLSEDQGFRVESHVFPKLQDEGSNGLCTTRSSRSKRWSRMRAIEAFAWYRSLTCLATAPAGSSVIQTSPAGRGHTRSSINSASSMRRWIQRAKARTIHRQVSRGNGDNFSRPVHAHRWG